MAQRGGGFQTNFPKGAVLPRGSLLNRMGSTIDGLKTGFPSGHTPYSGTANLPGTEAGFICGIAQITDEGSACPVNHLGEVDAPCYPQNKYTAVFSYFDGHLNSWQIRETTLRVDAGPYGIAIPTYFRGESVPAYFDPQSQWCIPIHSPPDYQNLWSFTAQQNIGVPRADKFWAITPNAVEVSLELLSPSSSYSSFGWAPLSPRLILKPEGRDGAVSGSLVVHTTLRNNEQLRLRCGTSFFSRAEMQVARHGMAIRFLAPTPNWGLGVPEIYGGTNGFATLPGLGLSGVSISRYKNAPLATTFGDYVRITMPDVTNPDLAEWEAEITIWAEARQSNLNSFVTINPNTGSQGESSLVDANEDGVHDAVVIERFSDDYADDVQAGRDMRCWFFFTDYPDIKVPAETGKIFGPCEYLGTLDLEGDARPVYGCGLGKEEYFAYLVDQDATLKKGETGEFTLFDGQLRNSGIERTAIAAANKVKGGKLCVISNFTGQYIANQIEC